MGRTKGWVVVVINTVALHHTWMKVMVWHHDQFDRSMRILQKQSVILLNPHLSQGAE